MIFTYHGFLTRPLAIGSSCFIRRNEFIDQLLYIRRRFRVVSLYDAVRCLKAGEERKDRPLAAITVDDGFQSAYETAFPFLLEYEIPATLFPVSGLIDTDRTLWYCRLHAAISNTSRNRLQWEGCSYGLAGLRRRARTSFVLQEKLKRLPHSELLQKVDAISARLGVDPHAPIEPGSPFRMLSANAIKKMAASGLIHFGSHTETHAILSRIPFSEQEREIRASRRKLRSITGLPCDLFAYPNGTQGDYSEETVRLLQRMNFAAAVTTIWGPNHLETPLMQLRRCGFDAGILRPHFRLQVGWLILSLKKKPITRRFTRGWRLLSPFLQGRKSWE